MTVDQFICLDCDTTLTDAGAVLEHKAAHREAEAQIRSMARETFIEWERMKGLGWAMVPVAQEAIVRRLLSVPVQPEGGPR